MKLQLPPSWFFSNLLALFAVVLMAPPPAAAEPLPLERAIRLALSHSTTAAIARADVQRTIASYRELRNNRIPQLNAGSGIGWSYGFPLTIEGAAPSLVTAVAQSSVLNFAQNQYLGAAKADIRAANLQEKDQRIAVIQDVALSYAELAKWEARLVRLQQDEAQVQQMVQAVHERVQEGIDSTVDSNKANPVEEIQKITRIGAQYSLECTGIPDVLSQSLDCLALTGVCGLIGVAPFGSRVSLDCQNILNGRTIRGIVEGDSIPDVFIPQLIDLFMQGRFPFDKMVSFYSLDQINKAAEDSEKGKVIKAVIRP